MPETPDAAPGDVFRSLFEQANDALFLVDPLTGMLVDASRKALERLGYSREEVLHLSVTDLHPAEALPRVADAVDRLRRGENVVVDGVSHRTRDGRLIPVEVSANLVEVGGSRLSLWLARDVSDRLRAQEFYRVLFQKSSDALFLVDDPDLRLLEVNDELCRLLGYSREEALRLGVPDIVPPDKRHLIPGVRAALTAERPFQRQRRGLLRKDGSVVLVDHSISRMEFLGRVYYLASARDITEQARAERELEEAKAFLEHLQENANDGFAVLDGEGRYVAVNRKMLEISGRRREDYLGRHYLENSDPKYHDAYKAYWDRLLSGETVRMRTELTTVGGQQRFVDVSSSPILRGGKTYVFAIVRDVTDQVRTEEALRNSREDLERRVHERTAALAESEDRYRTLADNSPVGIWQITADGYTLYANRSMCEILEVDQPEELACVTFHRFFTAEALETIRKHHELRRQGLSSSYEVEVLGARGGRRKIILYGAPILSPANEVQSLIATCVDVTEKQRATEALRKAHDELEARVEHRTAELARANRLLQEEVAERRRVEGQLRENESKLRAVVETVPDALFIQNLEGRVLAVNPAGAAYLGRSVEEVEGRTLAELFSPDAAEMILREDRRVAESGAPRTGEVQLPTPAGERTYLVTRVPYRTPDGKTIGTLGVARDVTEQKQAREELQFRKTLLESQTEAAIDGILVVSGEGKMISFNRRFVEMWGIPPDIVDSRSDEAALAFALGKMQNPGPFLERVKYLYQHPDEESRDEILLKDGRVFDRYSAPVKSADGVYYGRVWFFRDVSERRRSERELRKLSRAVEASSAIIVVTDAQRVIEYVNPRFTQVTGHRADEVIGTDARRLGTQSPEAFGRMWEAISSGREWRGVFRNLKRNGELYWELASISPVVNAEGEITHFIKVAEDITAQKAAERRQAAQLALTRVLSESASLGEAAPKILEAVCKSLEWSLGAIWRVDRAADVLRCVEIWQAPGVKAPLFEAASRGQPLIRGSGLAGQVWAAGKPAWVPDVVRLADCPRAPVAVREGLHAGFGIPILSGAQVLGVIEFFSREVLDRDGELLEMMGSFGSQIGQFMERRRAEEEIRRAVEETRRAYEDLKRAQAQLIRSEKLASIGMLVSGVAHEINNPLNVIYGNMKLLGEGGRGKSRRPDAFPLAGSARVKGMLRDVLHAAEHARAIVEDFRSFARDARTAEVVDLNRCLEEAMALVRRELGPKVRVVKRLGRVPPVRCFRGQIGQVFLNVLKNAAEAVERKGKITLRTLKEDGHAVVEVEDTGRGIPAEVQKKLFEPFFTTKPVGKGLGLGLSISAMIIHNHGGDISVKSRVGEGTTFRIRLPLGP